MKEMLYYDCESNSRFFSLWCNLIRSDLIGNQSTYQSLEARVDSSSGFPLRMNNSEGSLEENNSEVLLQLYATMNLIEGTIGMLKLIMIVSLSICCFLLVIACIRQ